MSINTKETIVVPDFMVKNMFRVKWPDGSMSHNIYNLTRATEFSKRLNASDDIYKTDMIKIGGAEDVGCAL